MAEKDRQRALGRERQGRPAHDQHRDRSIKRYRYGFASRFEDDRRGTSPEKILSAARAACFAMAFSFACDKAGLATADVDTTARVRLPKSDRGFVIDRMALTIQVTVPGIDEAKVRESAAAAKRDYSSS